MWNPSRLYFGADYNPEQWPRETWAEDIELMQELGVNLVTVGVFSWASLEVAEGKYEFGWLDDVLDQLHAGGIRVDLATATASPPAWLTSQYPSVCAVTREGTVLSHGGRQHYSPSSSVYREKAGLLVDQIASRYHQHPALEMWHVNNELGCHTPYCYGDESAREFRLWLEERYGSIDALNDAWQTTFWSQRYGSFDEVIPPRETAAGTFPNPGQVQDFRHFSSDQLLSLFVHERDVIRSYDSVHPITTNFMSMRHISSMDYWKWAAEVDFVSTDHYAEAHNPRAEVELAFQADFTRGLAGGKPWLLMEHSPAAVNWQPRNTPKSSTETMAHALSHIARGSEGVMFFQFKQSRGGSERFHSAMVPHIGRESRVFDSMAQLGRQVSELSALAGQPTEPAEVAIVLDYQSWWALQQPNLPSVDLDYVRMIHLWYEVLYDLGVRVDFLSPDAEDSQWQRYRAVFIPLLHVSEEQRTHRVRDYVDRGGYVVVSYFSGIADANLRAHLGSAPAKLIESVCGVRVEEFVPLQEGQEIALSDGSRARLWSEVARATSAEALISYQDGDIVAGSLAVSKNSLGAGQAWYLGTDLSREKLDELFATVVEGRGVARSEPGVDTVTRAGLEFRFTGQDVTIQTQGHG